MNLTSANIVDGWDTALQYENMFPNLQTLHLDMEESHSAFLLDETR